MESTAKYLEMRSDLDRRIDLWMRQHERKRFGMCRAAQIGSSANQQLLNSRHSSMTSPLCTHTTATDRAILLDWFDRMQRYKEELVTSRVMMAAATPPAATHDSSGMTMMMNSERQQLKFDNNSGNYTSGEFGGGSRLTPSRPPTERLVRSAQRYRRAQKPPPEMQLSARIRQKFPFLDDKCNRSAAASSRPTATILQGTIRRGEQQQMMRPVSRPISASCPFPRF